MIINTEYRLSIPSSNPEQSYHVVLNVWIQQSFSFMGTISWQAGFFNFAMEISIRDKNTLNSKQL